MTMKTTNAALLFLLSTAMVGSVDAFVPPSPSSSLGAARVAAVAVRVVRAHQKRAPLPRAQPLLLGGGKALGVRGRRRPGLQLGVIFGLFRDAV